MPSLPVSLESLLDEDYYQWIEIPGVYQKALPRLSIIGIQELNKQLQWLEYQLSPKLYAKAILLYTRLRTRYFQADTYDKLLDELNEEDFEDLELYPHDLVEKACKLWRSDPLHDFAPRSVGQLMESVRIEWTERKMKMAKMRTLLDLSA